MRSIHVTLLATALCLGASGAVAEPVSVDVVLSPGEEIRLDFQGKGRHFVQLLRRAGEAEGSGAFAGAEVVEYGMHDVVVGDGANAGGYLEATTTEGDVAYFRWWLRAAFVAAPDDGVRVVNDGHWELAGGTGQFESMRGVGTVSIEFVNDTDRRYVLEGDLSPAP